MIPHGDAPQQLPLAGAPGRAGRRRDAFAIREVCPLLIAVDGSWRSAYGSREHRCWAVRPPAPLVLGKQRQVCLVPGHVSCATFIAAGVAPGADTSLGAEDPALETGAWPFVRSTPLVLEPSRGRTGPLPILASRSGGQTMLVALMVLAFLVLVIARTGSPSTPGASPTAPGGSNGLPAASGQAASAGPGPSASGLPVAGSSPTPGPSPAVSASASVGVPSPSPTVARHYKVRAGDTLSGIAARFGTTVSAITTANDITAQDLLRIGQVLIIP